LYIKNEEKQALSHLYYTQYNTYYKTNVTIMKKTRKYSQSVDDSQLVVLYKNGEEAAFEELLLRHKNRIFTSIVMIVKDHETAEDLLQETFIKAVKTIKSGSYNEEGKFLPWISRIAHNMAIDHFRKSRRYPTLAMDESRNTDDYNPFDVAEDSYEDKRVKEDTIGQLKEFIKNLPETQREVLVMRQYMQMSFQEISEVTGVSINTALGRMRYALINLRKQMSVNNLESLQYAIKDNFAE
jgi:RNA polymerase sigma factor (sigma-70 family)